jgi:hypothetical protein
MRGIIHSQMKTDRAGEHLQRLQEALASYRASKPYTVTEYDDVKRGLYVFRIMMNRSPNIIPLTIGEFAYNLRSALDQLAWQLALLSGRLPSRDTQFPIHRDRDAKSEDRFRRLTWDMPCEAVKVIQTLQPYQRGAAFGTHPLWQLNQLCNLDKHCTMAINSDSLSIQTTGPPVDLFRRDLDDGSQVGVELAVPLAAKGKVGVEPELTETIFGRPIDEPGDPFELTEENIAEMHRFVRDELIPAFYPFFPFVPGA